MQGRRYGSASFSSGAGGGGSYSSSGGGASAPGSSGIVVDFSIMTDSPALAAKGAEDLKAYLAKDTLASDLKAASPTAFSTLEKVTVTVAPVDKTVSGAS